MRAGLRNQEFNYHGLMDYKYNPIAINPIKNTCLTL